MEKEATWNGRPVSELSRGELEHAVKHLALALNHGGGQAGKQARDQCTIAADVAGIAPLTDEIRRMLSEEITRKAGELVMAIDRAGRRLERAGDYSPQALLQRARERIEDADLYVSKALTR